MKAQRVHQFGSIDAITFEEIARPVPAEGEILVRVHAAGVGPWDAWVRAGKSALPQPLPLTLGADISGVVEAAGEGVAKFKSGDVVYGVTNPRFTGAYAEFAVAAAGMVAPKPEQLTHVEAASVPVVAVTAWQMVHDHARIQRGQSVLVHGAAGNVGAYAVQFAKHAGARVAATVMPSDLGYAQSLGIDQLIDSAAVRFEDVLEPVDAVIDTVGGALQTRSFAVLKRDGVLVSSVSQPDQECASAASVKAIMFIVDVTSEALTRIGRMIDGGDLSPHVGAVLPLTEARRAHEMLEGQVPRIPGRIVLRVTD